MNYLMPAQLGRNSAVRSLVVLRDTPKISIPYWPYAFPQLIQFGVRIVLFSISIRMSKPQIIPVGLRLSVARIAKNNSMLAADEGCG